MLNKLLCLLIFSCLVSCVNQNKEDSDSFYENDNIKDLKSVSSKWTDSLQGNPIPIEETPADLDNYDNIDLVLENEGPQEETD